MKNKIEKLRRNIIINSSASAILLVFLLSIAFYSSSKTKKEEKNINTIKSETQTTKAQTTELEGKIKDVEKYRVIWQTLGENKKTTQAIKIDEINKILKDTSDKHNISKTNIQVVLPSELQDGVFKRKTFKVLYATGTLSFDALSDVKAILFVEEFFNKLPGYFIMKNFEIKSSKKYESKDFVQISEGQSVSAVQVNIGFIWYSYRDK